MLVGPRSTKEEQRPSASACWPIRPTISWGHLALSTCPTFVDEGLSPRHIDLRPYVLSGQEMRLVPGGLTRVALTEGRWWSIRRRAAEPRILGDGG